MATKFRHLALAVLGFAGCALSALPAVAHPQYGYGYGYPAPYQHHPHHYPRGQAGVVIMPPPVYYAPPPPPPVYYAPPPAYYAPPPAYYVPAPYPNYGYYGRPGVSLNLRF
jgi:hypothetical protein